MILKALPSMLRATSYEAMPDGPKSFAVQLRSIRSALPASVVAVRRLTRGPDVTGAAVSR